MDASSLTVAPFFHEAFRALGDARRMPIRPRTHGPHHLTLDASGSIAPRQTFEFDIDEVFPFFG